MTKLHFHGAAGEVTGSMHVLEHEGHFIAFDCGLFQGKRSDANAKNKEFLIDPRKIDAVVLSHAHIDHSGRLPKLVKEGFTGTIYSTPATRDLAAILLADSAHIQVEDAAFYNRKRRKNDAPLIEPLYDDDDATNAIEQFVSVSYYKQFEIVGGIRIRFHDAGHILGSAFVEVDVPNKETGKSTKIVFSGDLGRDNMPILRDPAPLPPCDVIVTESTYGGRIHKNPIDMKERLHEQIMLAIKRSGKVIIPAFSVGRTQTIVYYLHQLMQEGRLPDIPIFVDSPLSVNATEIFHSHPECYDKEARDRMSKQGYILGSGICEFIRDVNESKKLNDNKKPCVIISASGMCEAGRILHHLANNVGDPNNTILIVGFQAMHTLGRRIVDREEEIKILGKMYPLRAHVKTLNGFSSHADVKSFEKWFDGNGPATKKVFIVHGESEQQAALADLMRELGYSNISHPKMGEAFEIN